MDAMQKQLGKSAGNPEAMDKLQKGIGQAPGRSQGLANKPADAAEAEKQKLSAALSSLSQQAAEAERAVAATG